MTLPLSVSTGNNAAYQAKISSQQAVSNINDNTTSALDEMTAQQEGTQAMKKLQEAYTIQNNGQQQAQAIAEKGGTN